MKWKDLTPEEQALTEELVLEMMNEARTKGLSVKRTGKLTYKFWDPSQPLFVGTYRVELRSKKP